MSPRVPLIISSFTHHTAKWILHAYKGYHLAFPFTHMNRETRVWVNIMTHSFFWGQHFTDVTRDRVCLVYALMTGMEINFGTILRSAIRKMKMHKGHKYALGGLITKLCCLIGVPIEEAGYCHALRCPPVQCSPP